MEQGTGVGQFWTPIRAKSGSLLHADSQISADCYIINNSHERLAKHGGLLYCLVYSCY